MFCPRCGREQASDNMRFCSRCGFALGGVLELLSTDVDQQNSLSDSRKRPSLYRKITAKVGAKIVFLSLVLLPVAVSLAIPLDRPWPLFIPLILFILGVTQIAYTLIFSEKLPAPKAEVPEYFNPAEARFGLPPTQNEPVPIFKIKRGTTSKMTPPPSVTESTTSLLELDDDKKF